MQSRCIVKCIDDDPYQERQGEEQYIRRFKRQQQDEHNVQVRRREIVQRDILQQENLQKNQHDEPYHVNNYRSTHLSFAAPPARLVLLRIYLPPHPLLLL